RCCKYTRKPSPLLRPHHIGLYTPTQRIQEQRATPRVRRRDASRVAVEQLALTEAVHRSLDEGARVQIGELLGRLEPFEDRRRSDEPPEPKPREQDLREGADVDDDATAVDGLEWQGRRPAVIQAAVEAGLDDRHLVARRDFEQPTSGLRGHRQSGLIILARLA